MYVRKHEVCVMAQLKSSSTSSTAEQGFSSTHGFRKGSKEMNTIVSARSHVSSLTCHLPIALLKYSQIQLVWFLFEDVKLGAASTMKLLLTASLICALLRRGKL